MKVALIHDWLNGMRGGERCLEAFLDLYPGADIYTMFHRPGCTSARIDAAVKGVSSLNRIPGAASKYYRYLLPLYPRAIAAFDLRGYDLVISLSHAAAKNVAVPAGVPHVCFCFTPMRYIWDQTREYFGAATPLLWPAIAALRRWDVRGSRRPTALVAISKFIAARIRCYYGRASHVIFPPVDTSWISPAAPGVRGEAFLYAGALVPYKRVDLVVEAFNQLGEQLWIVGSGPMEERLRRAAGANIRFFGRVSDAELAERYRRCRALLFPGTEDFGMIPVEAMAAGRPVIGIDDGALRETISGIRHWNDNQKNPGIAASQATGVFIKKNKGAELSELLASIRYFIRREHEFLPEASIHRAQQFSPDRFRDSWCSLLEQLGIAALPETPAGTDGVRSYA